MDYGARIERGIIIARKEDGYMIRSLDRSGITLPSIGAIDNRVYETGTLVYFFAFGDGKGKIIAAC